MTSILSGERSGKRSNSVYYSPGTAGGAGGTGGGGAGGANMERSKRSASVYYSPGKGGDRESMMMQLAPSSPQDFWGVNVYVKPAKRIHKRRFYLVVRACVRLLFKTRCGGTPLMKDEKTLTARLYYAVPPMTAYPSVTEALSMARLAVGVDDIVKFLARSGYTPGSTVTYRQFELLMMQLKKQYQDGKLVPDSEVAFVALGGGDDSGDRGGEVQTEQLINVCQTFRLTIDIQKFIDENDEDGSGLLDFGEFDAMFKAAAASAPSEKPPTVDDGNSIDLQGSATNIMRAVSAVLSMKSSKLGGPLAALGRRGSEEREKSDVTATGGSGGGAHESEEDDDTPRKKDNATVIEGINAWTENPPPLLKNDGKKKRRLSPQRVASGGKGDSSSTAATSPSRGSTRNNSSKRDKKGRGGAAAAAAPSPKKQAASPANNKQYVEKAVSKKKEKNAKRKEAKLPPPFGESSRRWGTDVILQPLPPASGKAHPIPMRSHPRDKEIDVVALVGKLRRDDENRGSPHSARAPYRNHDNNNSRDSSRVQTARTGTAASEGTTLPPVKPPQSPVNSQAKRGPKRWYSYNPFEADNTNEGGDPTADPLTDGGYSKDRQKNRLPAIRRRRRKTLHDDDDSEENGMGGAKDENSDLDGSDSSEVVVEGDCSSEDGGSRDGVKEEEDVACSDGEEEPRGEEGERRGARRSHSSSSRKSHDHQEDRDQSLGGSAVNKEDSRRGTSCCSNSSETPADESHKKEEEVTATAQRTPSPPPVEEKGGNTGCVDDGKVGEEAPPQTLNNTSSSTSFDLSVAYSIESKKHPGWLLALSGGSTVKLVHKDAVQAEEEKSVAWRVRQKEEDSATQHYALVPEGNPDIALHKPWASGQKMTCASVDASSADQWWELRAQEEDGESRHGGTPFFVITQPGGGMEEPCVVQVSLDDTQAVIAGDEVVEGGGPGAEHQLFSFVSPLLPSHKRTPTPPQPPLGSQGDTAPPEEEAATEEQKPVQLDETKHYYLVPNGVGGGQGVGGAHLTIQSDGETPEAQWRVTAIEAGVYAFALVSATSRYMCPSTAGSTGGDVSMERDSSGNLADTKFHWKVLQLGEASSKGLEVSLTSGFDGEAASMCLSWASEDSNRGGGTLALTTSATLMKGEEGDKPRGGRTAEQRRFTLEVVPGFQLAESSSGVGEENTTAPETTTEETLAAEKPTTSKEEKVEEKKKVDDDDELPW